VSTSNTVYVNVCSGCVVLILSSGAIRVIIGALSTGSTVIVKSSASVAFSVSVTLIVIPEEPDANSVGGVQLTYLFWTIEQSMSAVLVSS